jgi:peptidyl-dipeptidase Dcp
MLARPLARRLLLAAISSVYLSACGAPPPPAAPPPPIASAPPPSTASAAPGPPPARANPFTVASTLPFQAPPFDQIQDTDYEPAIELGMPQHLGEIATITALPDAPTFDNTIVAMERSGQLLTRVTNVFNTMTLANTSVTLKRVELLMAPKLAAHQDAVYLDPKLWARVKAVYDHCAQAPSCPRQTRSSCARSTKRSRRRARRSSRRRSRP